MYLSSLLAIMLLAINIGNVEGSWGSSWLRLSIDIALSKFCFSVQTQLRKSYQVPCHQYFISRQYGEYNTFNTYTYFTVILHNVEDIHKSQSLSIHDVRFHLIAPADISIMTEIYWAPDEANKLDKDLKA